ALARQRKPWAKHRETTMIRNFFGRRRRRDAVDSLYFRVAGAARSDALFERLGIPDTFEGRYEALILHLLLILRRLKRLPDPAADVAQDLVDAAFRELDRSLRELGVGDTSVPKRIKSLAQAFYGRV